MIVRRCIRMGTPSTPATRNCVQCGRTIAWDANVCQYCGHDYRAQATAPVPHEKTILSLVGGIFILLSGIIGIGMGAILVSVDFSSLDSYGISVATDFLEDILRTCGIILIVFGLIAVLGGVFGVMRKHFGLVIVGAVFGMLCVFSPYLIASIFGLVGLILVAVARKDFD